jgi:agmatinase
MNPKDWWDLAADRGLKTHGMKELIQRGLNVVANEAVDSVCDGTDAQYVSVDANIIDSASAPGVTCPEPGGLESRELMALADIIGARVNIGIIDVTELCPVMDMNGVTSKLLTCFLLRIAAVAAQARGSRVDPDIRRSNLLAE